MKMPPGGWTASSSSAISENGQSAYNKLSSGSPAAPLAQQIREVWWNLARQGHRLPAQRGVILIAGEASS